MHGKVKFVIALLATAALIGVAVLATASLVKPETHAPSTLKLMNRGPSQMEPPPAGALIIALRMPSTLALGGLLALTALWLARPRPGAGSPSRRARTARWALAMAGGSLLAGAAYRWVFPYAPPPRPPQRSAIFEMREEISDERQKTGMVVPPPPPAPRSAPFEMREGTSAQRFEAAMVVENDAAEGDLATRVGLKSVTESAGGIDGEVLRQSAWREMRYTEDGRGEWRFVRPLARGSYVRVGDLAFTPYFPTLGPGMALEGDPDEMLKVVAASWDFPAGSPVPLWGVVEVPRRSVDATMILAGEADQLLRNAVTTEPLRARFPIRRSAIAPR